MSTNELTDILETVNFVKDYMIKKFDEIDERFDGVDARFDGIDSRFDRLENEVREMRREFAQQLIEVRADIERLQHVTGYAKEIDSLMSRVATLEEAFRKQVSVK